MQELADRAALTMASAELFAENVRQGELLKQSNAELEARVKERTRELAEANARLQQLARLDGLTGLANRRAFDEALELELRRARREGRWLSLIMLDIDQFKAYNDHYGHPGGDACLQALAAVIKGVFRRAGDTVARYGGEEFAVILTDLGPEQARERAEQLREAVCGAIWSTLLPACRRG